MTIAELLRELQAFPDSAEVRIEIPLTAAMPNGDDEWWNEVHNIDSIKVDSGFVNIKTEVVHTF